MTSRADSRAGTSRLGKTQHRAIAESVGTFLLVLIGTGTLFADGDTQGDVGALGIALAFGFVVTAMIAAVGDVSGAYVRPFALLAAKKAPDPRAQIERGRHAGRGWRRGGVAGQLEEARPLLEATHEA